jgi:D-beta-D-heptose 7-phosphate kinase/D-beta-D-heptose 1-phosphate adenosyltransferase
MALDPHRRRMLDHGIPQIARCTVLVIGDIMIDRYVSGQVRRISPEAPIPVLRFGASRMVLGGAGNVANNIAALGARAILVGAVGADPMGADLLAHGVAVPDRVTLRTITLADRPTTVKTRFMSGSHQLLRLDEETAGPLAAAEVTAMLAMFESCLAEADVVVLSDYAKGVLCDGVLEGVIARAKAFGKRVIADPKRADYAAYRHVCVITPNEQEVTLATGIEIASDADAVRAGQQALAASEADAILVTRSERGLTLVQRDAEPLHLPTEAREVADVSGAGDSLVAAFAVMLAGGADLAEAAIVANAAAGVAVSKLGTATVSQSELIAALHRQELLALDDKTVPLASAQARLADWRRGGARIGFTNGCFDLIHPGHVRLLAKARARCDRLVVALNTDASVKRLKGPTRPVQNEMARATVMASIGAVDLVVLFDEDTPLEMIAALRPDIIFKGADYRIDQVVGGDLVQSYGGEVGLIDLEEGHSTTSIIRRMAPEPTV